MAYEIEIFEVEGGYGFKILKDGIPIIIQEFKPFSEGFQKMTREEAEYYANEYKKYLESLE